MKNTTEYKLSYPSAFSSAMKGKCPRCRKGDMFEGPLLSFGSKNMRDVCPHCELIFEKEPGYFYVSMYLSYVFVVAQLVTASVATYIFTNGSENPWIYILACSLFVLVLSPWNYRYSRIGLMYLLTPQFNFQPKYFELPERKVN